MLQNNLLGLEQGLRYIKALYFKLERYLYDNLL